MNTLQDDMKKNTYEKKDIMLFRFIVFLIFSKTLCYVKCKCDNRKKQNDKRKVVRSYMYVCVLCFK